jgi:hypothetical protein
MDDVALVTRLRDALKEYVCSTLGYDASLVSLDEEVVAPVDEIRDELVGTAEVSFGIDVGDRIVDIAITTPIVSRFREGIKEHLCSALGVDFTGPYEKVRLIG